MICATRLVENLPWVGVILGLYAASSVAALFITGFLARGGADWRGGLGALGGGGAGYLAGLGLSTLFPSLAGTAPAGFLPPIGALFQGMLFGICVGGGMALSGILRARRVL